MDTRHGSSSQNVSSIMIKLRLPAGLELGVSNDLHPIPFGIAWHFYTLIPHFQKYAKKKKSTA